MTYTKPTPSEVRAILARLGLSRTQAADLVGVQPRTVYRWQSGERDMAYAHLYTLLSRAAGERPEPETWRQSVL